MSHARLASRLGARSTTLAAAALLLALGVATPAPARAQSPSDVICPALNALQKYNFSVSAALPVISNVAPFCAPAGETRDIYYLGSAPTQTSPNDLLPLVALPFVASAGYLCGITESNGARAVSSAGPLSIETRLNVTERAGNRVKIERVGTVSLFGASAVLERQDFELSTPGENAPGNFGTYLDVKTRSGPFWFWRPPRLTFPIPAGPGTATISVQFQMDGRSPEEERGNQILTPSPAPKFQYDAWNSCVSSVGSQICAVTGGTVNGSTIDPGCVASCIPTFEPISKFRNDHLGTCAGACNVLNDGVLPYLGGFGGASGRNATYISWQPFYNWQHLGRPGPRPAAADAIVEEPDADIVIDNEGTRESTATLWGKLDASLGYLTPFVNITLQTFTKLAVRDGIALRQGQTRIGFDQSSDVQRVFHTVSVGAEAGLDVDANVNIDILPIGLVDPPAINLRLDNIYHRDDQPSRVVASTIHYRPKVSTSFTKFDTLAGSKPDPDAARLQCQFSPTPVTRAPTPPGDVGNFMRGVARGLADAIHPCNLSFCNANRQITCNWSATTKNLVCTSTPGCTSCGDVIAMCTADGNIIPGTVREFLRKCVR